MELTKIILVLKKEARGRGWHREWHRKGVPEHTTPSLPRASLNCRLNC
jgi:hypothetical protein